MTLREETEQINAETECIRQQRLEMERELAEPMNLNEQLRASIAMEDGEMGLMQSNPIRQRGIAPLAGLKREQSED